MRVAITSLEPSLNSPVDERFGRAKYVIVIDSKTGEHEVIDNNENANALQGAGIQAAQQVADKGVARVITGHVGPKAFKALELAGIQVSTGVSGTVQQALEAFKAGELGIASAPDAQSHW